MGKNLILEPVTVTWIDFEGGEEVGKIDLLEKDFAAKTLEEILSILVKEIFFINFSAWTDGKGKQRKFLAASIFPHNT